MKRRVMTGLLLLIFSTVCVFGRSVWEGNASMGRYGEFPAKGLYAATNSFERNTLIEVENLENGKKATVIVADRLEEPGLFLLLSREAAQTLGVEDDELARVRVTLAHPLQTGMTVSPTDRPYTSDPDINPSAAVGEEVPPAAREAPPAAAEAKPAKPEPEAEKQPEKVAAAGEEEPEPAPEPEAEPEEAEPPQVESLAEKPGEAPAPVDVTPVAPEAPKEEEEKAEPSPEPEQRFMGTSELAEVPAAQEYQFGRPSLPREPVEEPEKVAEEERVRRGPVISDVPVTAQEDRLDVAALDLPEQPQEIEVAERPAEEAVEEKGPQLTMLEASPEDQRLQVDRLDIPEEPQPEEVEGKGPSLAELSERPRAETEVITEEIALPEEPEEPTEAEVTEEAPEKPSEEPGPPAVVDAEKPSPEEPELPEDAEFVLKPAEPRPPEKAAPEAVPEEEMQPPPEKEEKVAVAEAPPEEPAAEAPAEEPAAEAPPEEPAAAPEEPFRTTGRLAKNSYYVQVGVYAQPNSVNTVVDNLSRTYPVTVYKTEVPRGVSYKVLLGPLNQDESGSVLFNIRNKGFNDAFIRRGE